MTINIMTESYPVDLSVTEQPIKLTISNLIYQAGANNVTSVNGKKSDVILTASDVGAEQVGIAASLIANVTTTSIGAATVAQGAKADSALQPSDVSTAGKTGSYNDLSNKPTIPVLPTLATVATSGSYTDLTNKPDLTLKQNSLPTTGTAGQFLAHDMTFKTPASGGGGSATTSNFGCGYQGFLPPVGNYVDNGILNIPISSTYHSVTPSGEMTLPFLFSKATPIDQIGMITRPESDAGFYRFSIYDSLANGSPDKVIYVSEQIDVTNTNESYCAASVSYTFEAGKMYWFRFSVNTNSLLFRSLGVGNNLSFGNSGNFNTNSPKAPRGNGLMHNGYFNPIVGSKYNGGNAITVYDIYSYALIPRIVMRRA